MLKYLPLLFYERSREKVFYKFVYYKFSFIVRCFTLFEVFIALFKRKEVKSFLFSFAVRNGMCVCVVIF